MPSDPPPADMGARPGYFRRWRQLPRPAQLYLFHAALLTASLAISSLFYNLTILALGYPRSFLGLLNIASLGVAGLLSLPLWWLASRAGPRAALLLSAALQVLAACAVACWPTAPMLLAGVAATGVAAVLFQVSAAPFMMRYSDAQTRDHLFSANAAINVGLAGAGSLLAGSLPGLFGQLLATGSESALAYRATFGVAAAGLALSLVPLALIGQRPAARGSPVGDGQAPAPRPAPSPPPDGPAPPGLAGWVERIPEPWRTMARRPGPLVQLLVSPMLISWGAALLIPYLNLFFKERFGTPDAILGAIFAALGIVTGVAALGGPLLSTRIGKIQTVVVTQALSIPFLIMLGFVPLFGVAVGAALVRGTLFNMGSPLYDAFAMERSDEATRPMVIGLINAAYASGYLVAPAISVLVQERYGFTPLFAITALCYGLAVLANYWFFGRPALAPAGPATSPTTPSCDPDRR